MYLDKVIDFRAKHEIEREPDRLPQDLSEKRVEIPILDASTRVWYDSREEMIRNLKRDDSPKYMIQTNVELATKFRPEMRQFMDEVFSANGSPILFHCAAGKDRTGFAAAILLRMLGVPQATVMEDYLLTNKYLPPAYKWNLAFGQLVRGRKFTDRIKSFMEARPEYLNAAFDAVDREWVSFENYICDGLGLAEADIEHLKMLYLE